MPPAFLNEVEAYIAKWRSTGRYEADLKLALDKGYVRPISSEFLSHQLPPQFLYLAMQESNFDPFASGPKTRYGIAKGMWQFIPKTGVEYGLKAGPLVDLPRPDPADGRHDWLKATQAAARYIKDLYSTDAQASGLLVMACYNWGEDQVLPLVRSMPANPRERNFWKLLANHRDKLPRETYDYVFYIVSAAVIGENPRLFGFSFDSPLAQ
ncbi:MAG: lytic transglycosylase domain-containing protein [Bryobacteraceae bacterium]